MLLLQTVVEELQTEHVRLTLVIRRIKYPSDILGEAGTHAAVSVYSSGGAQRLEVSSLGLQSDSSHRGGGEGGEGEKGREGTEPGGRVTAVAGDEQAVANTHGDRGED